MEFCPTCGNMLRYELPHMGHPSRFFCPTCPYVCQIESQVKIKRKQHLVKKEITPILTEEDMKAMKKTAPQTDATCPSCNFGRAIYRQEQTRSADEPSTIFYLCLNEKCNRIWRED